MIISRATCAVWVLFLFTVSLNNCKKMNQFTSNTGVWESSRRSHVADVRSHGGCRIDPSEICENQCRSLRFIISDYLFHLDATLYKLNAFQELPNVSITSAMDKEEHSVNPETDFGPRLFSNYQNSNGAASREEVTQNEVVFQNEEVPKTEVASQKEVPPKEVATQKEKPQNELVTQKEVPPNEVASEKEVASQKVEVSQNEVASQKVEVSQKEVAVSTEEDDVVVLLNDSPSRPLKRQKTHSISEPNDPVLIVESIDSDKTSSDDESSEDESSENELLDESDHQIIKIKEDKFFRATITNFHPNTDYGEIIKLLDDHHIRVNDLVLLKKETVAWADVSFQNRNPYRKLIRLSGKLIFKNRTLAVSQTSRKSTT